MSAGVRKAEVEWAVVGRALGPGGGAVSGQGARSERARAEQRYRRAGLGSGMVVAAGDGEALVGAAGLSDWHGNRRLGSDGTGGVEVG